MKKAVLFISAIISFTFVKAQIAYTDINPDSTVNTWAALTLHLSKLNPGYGDTGTFDIWFHPFNPNEVVITTRVNCEVMANAGNLPLMLNAGDSISSTKKWVSATYANLNKGNTQGLWLGGVTDKFLGLRFKKFQAGPWLYGWIRLDVDAAPNFYKAKDYAYKTTLNSTSILAGEGISIGMRENSLKRVSVFPNPSTTGKFIIDGISAPEVEGLEIYNSLGHKILPLSINPYPLTINLSSYPKGIYFIRTGNGPALKLVYN